MSANHEYWRINWRDWKAEEETTATEMLRRKCSYAEVATAVGRSEFAVERKNQTAWRIPYKQRNQVVRTCKTCGETFRRKRSLVERPGAGQFCRDACYRRYTGETNIERLIREELERRGVAFEQEYEIAGLRLDFFLPPLRAVIECDGVYWHSLPGRPEDDRLKDRFLTWLGFTVHRFTEVEIYGDPAACVARVLAAARPENAEREREARAS
jgi:very-short-patch-repair endonuclease